VGILYKLFIFNKWDEKENIIPDSSLRFFNEGLKRKKIIQNQTNTHSCLNYFFDIEKGIGI